MLSLSNDIKVKQQHHVDRVRFIYTKCRITNNQQTLNSTSNATQLSRKCMYT